MDVRDSILGWIKDICHCEGEIDENCSLFEDYNFDSVQIIELIIKIEEKYQIEHEHYDELMFHMDTIREFIGYFVKYLERNN